MQFLVSKNKTYRVTYVETRHLVNQEYPNETLCGYPIEMSDCKDEPETDNYLYCSKCMLESSPINREYRTKG